MTLSNDQEFGLRLGGGIAKWFLALIAILMAGDVLLTFARAGGCS
jgi:hypothetical protein